MKFFLPALFLACAASPVAMPAADGQNGTGEFDGYHLVWQDLFDSSELNPLRWNIEVNGAGGGNNELQYYTDRPENVRLGDDGEGNHCLILTARREEYQGKHFTSGRVNSKNLVTFAHGKIEAAIKLPKTANGLWPAFWMMGNDYDQVGWPRCGEIDICEFGHADGIKNGTQERYFNGAMHWGQSWPNASYPNAVTRDYSLQDGQFHVFTCYWTPQEVRMYVDLDKNPVQGVYFRMTCPCDNPDDEWSPGNYFHKLNFILFNLAIGGNFPAIWDAGGITALNPENGNEASMYINYVKVYQKGEPTDDSFFAVPGDEYTSIPSEVESTEVTFDGERVSLPAEGTVELFDISGRRVASEKTSSLDLSNFDKGCFIVKAQVPGRPSTLLKIRH